MRLKEAREGAGMTQRQLADLVGVEQNTVSQWEMERRVPRLGMLLKLAKVFNCTIDELVEEK